MCGVLRWIGKPEFGIGERWAFEGEATIDVSEKEENEPKTNKKMEYAANTRYENRLETH